MARRRKKAGESKGNGSPAWMTTFSDLMTLLLTFFILLYSFSTIDAIKFERAAAALQAVLTGNPSTIIFENDAHAGDTVPLEDPVPFPREEIVPADTQWELEQEILAMYETIKSYVDQFGLEADVQVSVTTRGVLVNISDAVLFDSGQAFIKPEGRELLSTMGQLLQRLENEVEVMGHTDNRPINTLQYPSNWELSVDRATRVVHFLIDEEGIAPGRLKASGYGEFRPVAPNNSPENMALNRRVNLLIVIDEEVGEQFGRAN